jgi:hypothetical protein
VREKKVSIESENLGGVCGGAPPPPRHGVGRDREHTSSLTLSYFFVPTSIVSSHPLSIRVNFDNANAENDYQPR